MTSQQFNDGLLERLAIFQDRINGIGPDDHSDAPCVAYAVRGKELYLIGRSSYQGVAETVGEFNRGDILVERTTLESDATSGIVTGARRELAVSSNGPHDGDPKRIQEDGLTLIHNHFGVDGKRFEQAGIVEHPWIESPQGVVVQPGDARLEIVDGIRLLYGWTEARDRTLERLMRDRPDEVRLSVLQREINSDRAVTAWFLEADGYDLHKIVWDTDDEGRVTGYRLEHLQFAEANSLAAEPDPSRFGDPPTVDRIAHSDHVPVDRVVMSEARILERSRQIVEIYQAQRVKDGGAAAADMPHDIIESGVATPTRPAMLSATDHPVLDLDDPSEEHAVVIQTLEHDLGAQRDRTGGDADVPRRDGATPIKPVVWPKVNFPRDFAHTFTRTARDGREYEMMTMIIPKGVRVNGVDLGGWGFDRFIHARERVAIANRRPVTITFKPNEPVNLWRGSGEHRETFTIDEPWDLCRAVKAGRDAYLEARAKERGRHMGQRENNRNDGSDMRNAESEEQRTLRATTSMTTGGERDLSHTDSDGDAAQELRVYIENSEELAARLTVIRAITDPHDRAGKMGELTDLAALTYANDPDFCIVGAAKPDETPFDHETRQAVANLLCDSSTPSIRIDEDAARAAKRTRSFDDYTEGSATSKYDAAVREIHDLAEGRKQGIDESFHERLDELTERYVRLLAERTNDFNRRSATIPSAMITGPANYPATKMRERTDSMMRHHNEQSARLDTIRRQIETCGERNRNISSTQGDAARQLETTLSRLKARQADMKQANQQARANHKEPPYPTSTLRNNNANMRRVQTRLEVIQRHQAAGSTEQTGETAAGERFTLAHDGESGYIFFRFEGKPSTQTRDTLKHGGFHWSSRESRWQRKMTSSAEFAIQRILEGYRPGESTGWNMSPTAPQSDQVTGSEHQRRQQHHSTR